MSEPEQKAPSPSSPPSNFFRPPKERLQALRDNWKWFLTLGLGLIFLGFLALGSTLAVGEVIMWIVAVLFLISGIGHTSHAVFYRDWSGFLLELLLGILYLVVGIGIITHIYASLAIFTLFLGLIIMGSGVSRVLMAIQHREFAGWVWLLIGGILSILLGMFIVAEWPDSTEYVLGIFIAIELLGSGLGFVMLGLTARQVSKSTEV